MASFRSFPELPIGSQSEEACILSFYRGIGWDGTSELVTAKVAIHPVTWVRICEAMIQMNDARISMPGLLWTLYGPVISKDVPEDEVRLKDGWMFTSQDAEELVVVDLRSLFPEGH